MVITSPFLYIAQRGIYVGTVSPTRGGLVRFPVGMGIGHRKSMRMIGSAWAAGHGIADDVPSCQIG